jgi:pimeloyl-ACP methyl ester carboxylesterase
VTLEPALPGVHRNSVNTAPIFVLPGMGADNRMYSGPWRTLPRTTFLDWPSYHNETTIAQIASRLVDDAKIADGSIVIGSSLGGIVACEIARIRNLKTLVLIGSAINRDEICSLLSVFHPITDFAPLKFLQAAVGKLPGDLTQMFSRADAEFIRAMCRAIFTWDGLQNSTTKLIRIHGRHDRVIPLPKNVDSILDAGHLVAMTHADACTNFLRTKLSLA